MEGVGGWAGEEQRGSKKFQPPTPPHHPTTPSHSFAVDHYAGRVTYSAATLMAKNRDFTVAEHAALLRGSKDPFAAALFEDAAEPADAAAGGPAPGRDRRAAFKLNSVGAQFRRQLGGLIGALSECQPHYIRCVKPNPASAPVSLDPAYVLDQLRAGGVLEAVRIACAGFPTRKPFRAFVRRYGLLLPPSAHYDPGSLDDADDASVAALAARILDGAGLVSWQAGKTRVFLRAGQLATLEGARGRRLTQAVLVIQSAWRAREARRELAVARAAATRIAAAWRGHAARKARAAAARDDAAHAIQAAWRARAERRAFLHHVANRRATTVQRYARGWLARMRFRRATQLGRRQAARAAEDAARGAAATRIQAAWRGALARSRVTALRDQAAKWADLEESKSFLESQVAQLRAALTAAEARADAADAARARAASDLAAAAAEAAAAREAAAAATAAGVPAAASADAVPARALAELEAAHAAATAALHEELNLLRAQKAAAEEAARAADVRAAEARADAASACAAADDAAAALVAKQADNDRLWDAQRAAAEEYAAELAAKDAAVGALGSEAATARAMLQAEIDALRDAMEAEVATARTAMQARLDAALAEAEAKAVGLRDAREKNVHFSARVVALNSRVASLQKAGRDAAARERELAAELDALRAALASESRSPRAPSSPRANGRASPPLSPRAVAAAGAPPGRLAPDQEAALSALAAAAVPRRLPIVNIQHGSSPGDAVGLPFAAWLVGECLLTWASSWHTAQVDAAAGRLRDAVLAAADGEGLAGQAYWLSASLALGALLKVRSIGRRDCGGLFRAGDDMIQFAGLHALVASSITDALPLSAGELLGEDAKRAARAAAASARRAGAAAAPFDGDAAAARSYEELMASPWKGLLGGLSNVLETLRGEGAPPPACRSVVTAALRALDAHLLNALLLRRDCCSTSAVKALAAGLADVRAWVAYVGAEWAGDGADADAALEHAAQAARYLLTGRDDCVRRAAKGFDVSPDLRRLCPSLTLDQVYRLTEHAHDDWLDGAVGGAGAGGGTLALLAELKRAVAAAPPPAASTAASLDGGASSDDEGDALLLDPVAAFVLPRRLLTDAARHYVQAPRPYHSAAPGVSLLDRIEACCRGSVALPQSLKGRPEFAFLMGTVGE